jgi:hypothetical protein
MARKPGKASTKSASVNPDYAVGYGKPPKATRFPPGQSGNPKGRRKGTRNFGTHLRAELAERITVQEGGKTKQIDKLLAMIKSAINNSIKGNPRALREVLTMMEKAGLPFEEPERSEISEDDATLLEMFYDRMQRRQGEFPGVPEGRDFGHDTQEGKTIEADAKAPRNTTGKKKAAIP